MESSFILLMAALALYGLRQGHAASGRRSGLAVVGGAAVALALLIVIDPQIRVLLMVVDSVTVEVFFTVCALFLRHHVQVCAALVVVAVLRLAYRLGPLQGFWPYREIICKDWLLAGYAVLMPVVVASMGILVVYCAVGPLT